MSCVHALLVGLAFVCALQVRLTCLCRYAYYIFSVDDIEVLERDFGAGLATGNPYREQRAFTCVHARVRSWSLC